MRIFPLLLAAALVALTACAAAPEPPELRGGIYVADSGGDRLGPYIRFDTETDTWESGGSLAMSYFIGGEYEAGDDGRLTLTGGSGGVKIVIEIEIKDDGALAEVLSVGADDLGWEFWFAEGNMLAFASFGAEDGPDLSSGAPPRADAERVRTPLQIGAEPPRRLKQSTRLK